MEITNKNHSIHTTEYTPTGVIVRSRKNIFSTQTERLKRKYYFEDLNHGKPSKSLKTPYEYLLFFLHETWFVIRNISKLNRDIIIVCGVLALPIKLLLKLKLVRCKHFLWFGFFIHSDNAFKLFKILLKLLKLKNEKIIVNSHTDIKIYSQRLNVDINTLTYIPMGNWSSVNFNIDEKDFHQEDYYFAGGYTNRDYKSLIEIFNDRSEKLIIVGSKLNRDLRKIDIPQSNIKILKDIDKNQFELLLANAKVCILPLKNNRAGACGHMVLLAYMRRKKTIICPNLQSMREYLTENESGLFYNNIRRDLPNIISNIEEGKYNLESLGIRAYKDYEENFTYPTLAIKLDKILDTVIRDYDTGKNITRT